jgi:hypothetical protein
VDVGEPWKAEEWAAYYRGASGLPMPSPSANAAKDLLEGLQSRLPLIAELEAAVDLPHAHVLPRWTLRYASDASDSRIAHLGAFFAASKCIVLAAQAAAAGGEPQAAAKRIAVLIRFTEGTGNDPLLINSLVTLTIARIALDPAWTLLNAREASDESLVTLQRSLERLDIRTMTTKALEGEMIWVNQITNAELNDGAFSKRMLEVSQQLGPDSNEKRAARILYRFNPKASVIGGNTISLDVTLIYGLKPLQSSGLHGFLNAMQQCKADFHAKRFAAGPFGVDAGQLIDSVSALARRALIVETRIRQTRIAIALERFFLAHQHYPENLTELVPDYLPNVPSDLIDDHPMRYRRTDQRYKLWSIGTDNKDDGGSIIGSAQTDQQPPNLQASDYSGDWVWSYEPLLPTKTGF